MFDWNYIEFIGQDRGYWYHNTIESSNPQTYLSIN